MDTKAEEPCISPKVLRNANHSEQLVIAAICCLAAVRIFIFSAAFACPALVSSVLLGLFPPCAAHPDPAVTTNGVLETKAAAPAATPPAYSDYPLNAWSSEMNARSSEINAPRPGDLRPLCTFS